MTSNVELLDKNIKALRKIGPDCSRMRREGGLTPEQDRLFDNISGLCDAIGSWWKVVKDDF